MHRDVHYGPYSPCYFAHSSPVPYFPTHGFLNSPPRSPSSVSSSGSKRYREQMVSVDLFGSHKKESRSNQDSPSSRSSLASTHSSPSRNHKRQKEEQDKDPDTHSVVWKREKKEMEQRWSSLQTKYRQQMETMSQRLDSLSRATRTYLSQSWLPYLLLTTYFPLGKHLSWTPQAYQQGRCFPSNRFYVDKYGAKWNYESLFPSPDSLLSHLESYLACSLTSSLSIVETWLELQTRCLHSLSLSSLVAKKNLPAGTLLHVYPGSMWSMSDMEQFIQQQGSELYALLFGQEVRVNPSQSLSLTKDKIKEIEKEWLWFLPEWSAWTQLQFHVPSSRSSHDERWSASLQQYIKIRVHEDEFYNVTLTKQSPNVAWVGLYHQSTWYRALLSIRPLVPGEPLIVHVHQDLYRRLKQAQHLYTIHAPLVSFLEQQQQQQQQTSPKQSPSSPTSPSNKSSFKKKR